MQIGFYFDQSRCIGCYTCMAACRSWNELGVAMPDIVQITSYERGRFPEVSVSHLFLTCFHCAEPVCVPACPQELLAKRPEDGIVVITRRESCTGCQVCVEACPYGAPKVVAEGGAGILKCDLCLDRLSAGKAPACVAACPVEALDAGPIEKLVNKYGELRQLDGFANYRKTNPSVVFRAMRP